jgi:hypothetical protein
MRNKQQIIIFKIIIIIFFIGVTVFLKMPLQSRGRNYMIAKNKLKFKFFLFLVLAIRL